MSKINRKFRDKIVNIYKKRSDLIPHKSIYARLKGNKIECCAVGCAAISVNPESEIPSIKIIDNLVAQEFELSILFIQGVMIGFDSKCRNINKLLKNIFHSKCGEDYHNGVRTGFSIQKAVFGGKK